MRVSEGMIVDGFSNLVPLCFETGKKGSNEISKRGNCAKIRLAFSKRNVKVPNVCRNLDFSILM